MNIIFLDVDGVLNNKLTRNNINKYYLNSTSLQLLSKVVNITNSYIVLSTNWRSSKNLTDILFRYLATVGIYRDRILDITNSVNFRGSLINFNNYKFIRFLEILNWLCYNTDKYYIKNWVILDDINLNEINPLINNYFINTDDNIGLDIDKSIELYNKIIK